MSQGSLELMCQLERALSEISGFAGATLAPAAGAQGELCGVMMIRAYHVARGNPRRKVLIPDTAHGTNPATCALNGYEVVQLASGPDGRLHPETVRAAMDEDVAAIMITNPNTLGMFESHIAEIAEIVHAKGGLVYGDGANLNALLGVARPGDMGFDVMQFNLHKTFATPHGGGGPGSGPVARVRGARALPAAARGREGGRALPARRRPEASARRPSAGSASSTATSGCSSAPSRSSASSAPRACARPAELAVLNANYVRARLEDVYHLPYETDSLHEVVLRRQGARRTTGVTTMDVAKRLIDHGFHPPTVYFPLVVHGALMIEPTETESKETSTASSRGCSPSPSRRRAIPRGSRPRRVKPVRSRLDEVRAARKPVLRWRPGMKVE